MEKAYLNVIKFGLNKNMKFTVTDGMCEDKDDADLYMSDSYKAIKEEVEAVDDANLYVVDNNGKYVAWFRIIAGWDMQPEETVVDFSVNSFTDEWEKQYEGYK